MAIGFRCEHCQNRIVVRFVAPGEEAVCRVCERPTVVPEGAEHEIATCPQCGAEFDNEGCNCNEQGEAVVRGEPQKAPFETWVPGRSIGCLIMALLGAVVALGTVSGAMTSAIVVGLFGLLGALFPVTASFVVMIFQAILRVIGRCLPR